MILLLLTIVWMVPARDCGAFMSTFNHQINGYSKCPHCVKRHDECLNKHATYRNQTLNRFTGIHFPVSISNVQQMEHFKSLRGPQPSSLPHLIWVLPIFDYVVSNFIRAHGTYSIGELNYLFKLLPPSGFFVDIGANVGAYAIPIADHVGPRGLVWAFEPFRLTRQMLSANAAINGLINVHIFECGISDKFDEVVAKSPSFTKMGNVGNVQIYNQTPAHETSESVLRYDGEEKVCMRPLDSFKFHRKIDLIKIDVEDHAEQVLEGARETIATHRPILSIEAVFVNPRSRYFPILRELNYHCRLKSQLHEVTLCVPREVARKMLNTTWPYGL